jgi:TonB family protein
VEKSPLLFSHEVPKPKLEPGRVVSVTVSWIVTPEGLVDDPKIEVSATPEIDAFVVEAVKKWRYEPGQKAGKTVPVRVLRKYTFGQRGSEGS